MKTDYVDVMQFHNPSVEQCEQGALVEALREMRQQGKVQWLGISTGIPHLSTYLQWGVFDVFQIPYSALLREHENWISKSAEAGIGTVIRGGVAQGEPGQGRGGEKFWRNFEEAKLDELRKEGESRSAFVLRLALTHPNIHTIIAGTINPVHLKENV
jgi:aryl-alcohol dehydrogenase-like predicted oxidoreductase